MLMKLKRLVTGDYQDLASGEVVTDQLRLREKVDPVPMAPPVNYSREPSLMELIKGQMLRHKAEQLAAELGAESPAESEDFDIDDPEGFEPGSPHEHERHDYELLVAYEKLQRHHQMLHDKYGEPLPGFMQKPVDDPASPPSTKSRKSPSKAPEGPRRGEPATPKAGGGSEPRLDAEPDEE